MMPRKIRLAGAALLLLAGGCGKDDEPWCDICGLSARVVGDVRTPDGLPVRNALVRMVPLYPFPCCGVSMADDTVRLVTDGAGRFDGTVVGMSIAGPDRVEVRINPLPDDGLMPLADTLPASFAVPWEEPETVRQTFYLTRSGSG